MDRRSAFRANTLPTVGQGPAREFWYGAILKLMTGFVELEALRKDDEFVLLRCEHSNQPGASSVLLLAPASARPTVETLRKLEHEYSLRDQLDSAWAVRPLMLAEHRGDSALVLEDPGGESLDRLFAGPMEIKQFLHLAVGLATALTDLHRRGLIHKDLKPANVLVPVATGEVRLMGFGIASRLSRERHAPEPAELIAGTLPYMAPEQTGRMNRSIDSRSDLYALGVTLYEMLTGVLPFTASDPMEWVHCHIARQPVPPSDRLNSIASPISAIIMKLLAKTPEERYQTAAGAASDLRRCLLEWEAQRRIDEFPLGEQDKPDRLLIPEKLYGRESEVAALLASFDRVVQRGTPELVLVSGYSGIGKSSVVNELHKPLVPPHGLFAFGKFDQYKRDIPYVTLAQAFQSLLRLLLTKSEADLAPWRDALREALGPNGRLIVDLVPELEPVIGEQPLVPELPPQDARRRFQLVFRRFLDVFARPEHPLALFLDDLQWVDLATLDLLEDLLTRSEVQHIMLIGAYRDNEVTAAHPLMRKLEAIKTAGGRVKEFTLGPLAREHLGQLIADALHCELEPVLPLAQLVYDRTAGNPFFAIQFLSALEQESLLVFDHAHSRWLWDLDRIHAKGYTDNVADLVVAKLRRLPAQTQKALQQLACLGNTASVTILSLVFGAEESQVHSDLFEAVRSEMIERQQGVYRFIHDRVHEAAYSLIPEELRPEAHLRIGRLLLAHTAAGERQEAIFEIVNQLNRGAALISSREEREELAELNLIAGHRAKASAAYASALAYLASGAAMLPEDCWERRHDLTFALELNRAECEYVTAQLGRAEERLATVVPRAVAPVERAAVAALRMDLYSTLDQTDMALAVGLSYLRDLGVEWPPHPSEEEARHEYERIWSRFGTREIEDLIDLPLLSDRASIATLDILTKIATSANRTDKNLQVLAGCRAVNLSLELGNCDASCIAYEVLAVIAGTRFGDYQVGYRFGRLGYELAEQRGWTRIKPRAYSTFGGFVVPWTKPFESSRDLLRRAFDIGNSIGDVIYAVASCVHMSTSMLMAGDHLIEVERECERGVEFAGRAGFGQAVCMIAAQLGLVRTLRGFTRRFGSFDDEQFHEQQAELRFASNPNLQLAESWYWIRKLQARFLAGDHPAALYASQQAERLCTSEHSLDQAEYYFYGALTRAACLDSVSADERHQHLEALAAHHRQIEIWARNCPENFENRAALVSAEIARIEGRELEAEYLYKHAIRSAHDSGSVHNEGLAYEIAARFYAARGFDKIADSYLLEARYCYQRWGAEGKVKQLDQLYPHLKKEGPVSTATSTIMPSAEVLDLATVIKISQAVSGEMVMEKLIEGIMCAAIEYAGAERGLLVLPRGDELRTLAEATIRGIDVTVHLRGASLAGADLPESLVRYVARTHESVILDDASSPNTFSADPYVVQHRVRSVLCLPLINQAKLIGALYLENNLTPHAFTPERIAVLKLLASQAAISLEKTRLYRDLEDREAKIRRLVDANILGVVIGNSEGRIVTSNEAFLHLVQYDREDLVSGRLHWTNLTPAEWRKHDERASTKLKETGTVQPYEKELFRKDGSRVPVLVAAALFEEGGSEAVAFALDLSEQKRAEAEIRTLKDQLYRENLVLREEVDRTSMFEEIVGTSKPLEAVLSRVAKVAPTDSTVFITGETGTGKELIARAVHKRSRRAERAFVGVNCAALPPALISSELFGYEKGAFTGAAQRRLGRFELADGGTIFLDEVGELPPDTQIALLRILQEREFERVGGTQSIKVNVRVIAATNRDLKAAVADGVFRQDLFYRLNVFPIEVPPLRERKEDILLLVEYFVRLYANRAGRQIRSVDKKTMDLLQAYGWPGNIRELQNIIERSVILSSGEILLVDESWFAKEIPTPRRRAETPEPFTPDRNPGSEREIIEAALAECRGRVSGPSGAALRLGIPQSTLAYKIKVLGISKSRFRFR
jgi:PAS domain S-box-containing protein